ncbi:MAG TPA: response regulator [Steroidobacteraceae bacterium]|nr:response regulator [Steroidobacteraceae bacterium]
MNTQRKVLVVDDDPVVARSFDRVLTGKGYAVISARDGVEALQKLKDEKYDVVFTDIKMPGMNGIEVARRIKASQPWLPVVIVTGYGTEDNEAQARAAGVAGFLRKPLSPEEIEGSTEQALHEVQAAPEARAEAAAAAPVPAQAARVHGAWKGFALFLAAPFIGLFYLVVGPLVGLAVLAWMGARAIAENRVARKVGGFLKNVGLFIAAPFIGLLYAMLFPFIGLGMLAWTGVRTLMNRPGPQ